MLRSPELCPRQPQATSSALCTNLMMFDWLSNLKCAIDGSPVVEEMQGSSTFMRSATRNCVTLSPKHPESQSVRHSTLCRRWKLGMDPTYDMVKVIEILLYSLK